LQADNLRTARAEFIEAVRLKPRYTKAHYNLASTLHQQGEEAKAQAEFDKGYEIAPELRNAPRP
jgi:Tfp pilus assembly protein PilF